MAHNPLSQFDIKTIYNIDVNGYDISFTNASAHMVAILLMITTMMLLAVRSKKIVPTKFQAFVEVIYKFAENTLSDTTGGKGSPYFPFVLSVFMFVLFANLLGMLPYTFTVTSHIVVTFALAMFVFLFVTILGFIKHGLHFFSFFLPKGTPWWLAPLMIIIELFSYLARPVSLSVRLAANMIAGHILLKVIAGFILMLGMYFGWVPLPFIIVFTAFEIFIAILQAYIFTILSCVYFNDAINLH